MVIQSNMPALNAHRNLAINNSNLSRNLERLSSGFRINRAGDDAAGLSISERMRTQIRGLAQAEMNTQNGIQLIQTAEGGLNETHAILQRMRELAVMSSNATFQDSDREQIHLEVVALIDEIDRISSSTHYNRINLLDGTFGSTSVWQDGTPPATANGQLATGAAAAADIIDPLGIGAHNAAGANATLTIVAGQALDGVTDMNARIIVTSVPDMDGVTRNTIALQVGDNTFMGVADVDGATGDLTGGITFRDSQGNAVATIASAIADAGNVDFTDSETAFSNLRAGVMSNIRLANNTVDTRHASFAEYSNIHSTLTFQIGANGGLDQRAALQVVSMSAGALGRTDINGNAWTVRDLGSWGWFDQEDSAVAGTPIGFTRWTESNPGVTILTQNGANAAIDVIDSAIDQVSAQRARLGAMQNRMESTLNSLGVARENLTAAESTIRDVDMAQEMMSFTTNNILTQAAQAMLAQANQLPQGILQLLR